MSDKDDQPDGKRSWPIHHWITIGAVTAWFVGSIIRWTVRDAWPATSAIFYALPVPVLIASGCLTLLSLQKRLKAAKEQRPRIRAIVNSVLIGVLLLQLLVWLPNAYYRSTSDSGDSETWRFMFWNTYHGELGEVDIAKELADSNCDLIALVEAPDRATTPEVWQRHLPEHTAYRLGSQMTILARKQDLPIKVIEVVNGNLPASIRYRIVKLLRGEHVFRIIVIDINSNPFRFRRREFQRLAELAREFESAPLILAGDFNTPVDSVYSELLRNARLSNAFDDCGVGYRPTWPVYFPMLTLDQVWTNSSVSCRSCWREASWNSDHRRVVVEFEFSPETQMDRN